MLTTQDFLKQYEILSDAEIYDMHLCKDDFSAEGQEAIALTIERRGGLERIEATVTEEAKRERERMRIKHEASKFAKGNADPEFVSKLIGSDTLPPDEIQKLVTEEIETKVKEQKDTAITPRTVYGSVLGGAVATVVGGILLSQAMVRTHRLPLLFLFAIFAVSYGLIKLFTKQSKNNVVVLVASILSTALAAALGNWIAQTFQ